MHKYTINPDIFETIDTEEKAYWLGFIAADGCVTYGGKHGRQFDLRVNLGTDDYEHLVKLKKFLGANHPIQYITKYNKKKNKYYYSYLLRICCKKIVEDLIKNKVVPAKSKILEFPNIKKELEQHYIRGIFDGDGGWKKSKDNQMSFAICSANELFIKTLLEKICISTELHSNKTLSRYENKIHIIGWSGNNNCEKIFDWLYKDATIFLDRKYEKSKHLKDNNVKRVRNRGQKVYEVDKNNKIIKIHKNTFEAAKYYNFTKSKVYSIIYKGLSYIKGPYLKW